MVRSKAKTHFRQYIRNKPTKWGFKYWVLADVTAYTVDFDIYIGSAAESSGKGLSFDVVIKLVEPYKFQGYDLYFDNFYTSPTLLDELIKSGIVATGTLNVKRKKIPNEVVLMRRYVDEECSRGPGIIFVLKMITLLTVHGKTLKLSYLHQLPILPIQ